MDKSLEINDTGSNKKRRLIIIDAHEFSPPYIHPITRFLIYSYFILLTGNVFMAWTGFQEILYKAGSFEELCDIANSRMIVIGSHHIIDCPARKAAMNELYTIAFSVNFIFSFFSGTILNIIGHKLTFLFGHIVNFFCWIFLGLFPKNGSLIRVVMVVIGLTAECMYLPLTTVSLYFPGNKSLILSILGSIRSLSFLMSTILSYVYLSPKVEKSQFYLVAISFGFVAYFGSFLIGLFVIPMNFFSKKHLHLNKAISNDCNFNVNNQNNTRESPIIQNEASKSLASLHAPLHKLSHGFKILLKFPDFFQTILFTIACSLNVAAVEFLNKAQRELFYTSSTDSIIDLFRYVQISTFLPGLFTGYFADRIGTCEIMIPLQSFLLLSYLLLTVNTYTCKMIACLSYLIGGCMYLSNIYFYVYENFPPETVGIILGFILIFCGCAILCNIPLYNYALKIYKIDSFYKISWVLSAYMIVSVLSNVIVIFLKRCRNKRLKSNQM